MDYSRRVDILTDPYVAMECARPVIQNDTAIFVEVAQQLYIVNHQHVIQNASTTRMGYVHHVFWYQNIIERLIETICGNIIVVTHSRNTISRQTTTTECSPSKEVFAQFVVQTNRPRIIFLWTMNTLLVKTVVSYVFPVIEHLDISKTIAGDGPQNCICNAT